MQLEFQKQPLRYLAAGFREVKNTEVTQEIRLSEGMPDIGRVLATWGQVILRSKQWQGTGANVTGGVMTWTLYVPEDSTEPKSVECWIPFELKWDAPQVNREGPMMVFPLLRFADSRSISARKIMVRAGVAALAQGFYPEQSEIAAAAEVPEDVQLLKNTYPLEMAVEAGEKIFTSDEEIHMDPSATPEKMLSGTVLPEVTETRVISDKIAMKGRMKIHLLCRYAEGKLQSTDHELTFSQLIQLDEAYGPEAWVDIQMAVTNLEADMAEPGRVRIKVGLTAQYVVTDRKDLELVQDAYSTRRSVEADMTSLELPVILEDRMETVTAEQLLPGQFGMTVDGVFLPDFPHQRRNGIHVELEIPGLFQSLLYGEDSALQGVNARWEGHFSLAADGDTKIVASVQSQGAVQNVTTGDGLRQESQMHLHLQSHTRQQIPMVTGLELGAVTEPDGDRPSVVVTVGGAEPLWDLAKRCGSTVAAIRAANGLEGEPVKERMLLIPVI